MFGKNGGGAPPDVGDEDAYDAQDDEDSSSEDVPEIKDFKATQSNNSTSSITGKVDTQFKLDFERLRGRVESISEWVNQVQERFSYISENMGELRNSNLNNEKKIALAIKDSSMASSLVKEMQPDKLRLDYKRLENKMMLLSERIEANKQFHGDILTGFNEIKKKSEAFIGTEGLIKLNSEVKKDLMTTEKLASRVHLHADKSDQIFVELKSTLAEMQKVNSHVVAFNNVSEKIKSDIEKIKIDHSKVLGDKEFDEFKKFVNKKFALLDKYVDYINELRDSHNNLIDLVEKNLRLSKVNKDNINNLAIKIGQESITGVDDYEGRLNSLLSIVDALAGEVLLLKETVGIKQKKIAVGNDETSIGIKKVQMQNVKLHPEIAKDLVKKPVSPPVKLKEVPKTDSVPETLPRV